MKKNFIILVGSDGSGKSTIANGLNTILGYNIEHFGPPKNYEDGKTQYFDFIKYNNEDVVCDRFHEGEAIFAPLYRNYDGSDYFPELEKELMKKFNVLLVLVYAPFETIKQRLEERGEDFVKPQHFFHCYDKVLEVFNDSSLPKIMVDTSVKTPAEIVENIVKRIIL